MTAKKGRPSKLKGIDTLIVRKLAEAFRNDFTVEEACSYAGIAKDTYYRWLREDGEFSYEMEGSKDYVAMEAKKVLKKAILKGDLRASQWFLERRQRDRYSPTSRYEIKVPEELTEDEEKELEAVLAENL